MSGSPDATPTALQPADVTRLNSQVNAAPTATDAKYRLTYQDFKVVSGTLGEALQFF